MRPGLARILAFAFPLMAIAAGVAIISSAGGESSGSRSDAADSALRMLAGGVLFILLGVVLAIVLAVRWRIAARRTKRD